MAGRPPKLNWTESRKQYTVTIGGTLHHLGADKAKAEEGFRFLLRKHDLHEPVEKNPTFASVVDRWLDHQRPKVTEERYRLAKARLEEFLLHVGLGIKVSGLRPHHVEGWLSTRTPSLKPGTIRLYTSMVSSPLNWAAEPKVRLIPSNPLKGLLDLPEGASRGGEAVWSDSLFQAVVCHTNPAFANVLRILAWTGARPSTICQVEAQHYRPRMRLWDVESLYRDRESDVKYVKRIWLPPQAVELVEKLNREHPVGPVFRNSKGRPWSPETLGTYMYNVRHKFKSTMTIDWPKQSVYIYGLRHTFATKFIIEHPDKLEYLRELLGHKDLKMIRKHYGHLFDEHAAMHDVLGSLRLSGHSPSESASTHPALDAGTGA